jgi:hypothetical protein
MILSFRMRLIFPTRGALSELSRQFEPDGVERPARCLWGCVKIGAKKSIFSLTAVRAGDISYQLIHHQGFLSRRGRAKKAAKHFGFQ